jgi:hypothetical protein
LLESSHQGGSNGGKIAFLASLDGELVYQKNIYVCSNILPFSDARNSILPPLEPP